ncbi:MAG: gamma-glutamyltransferase family protein, partial [Candidatus Binatia bacterium]
LVVVEPTNDGVGSDAFAMVWDGHDLHGINGSGCSPSALAAERFEASAAMPMLGWDTVTVPGAVSVWVELSRRFGRLAFASLFEPAIGYAREGFVVSPVVARQWALTAGLYGEFPEFAAAFLPGGRAPAAGETFRLPDLAVTLEEIAASVGESFYRGEIARRIAAHARATGGLLDERDLAEHRPEWVEPMRIRFRDHELCELPPNTQGIAALQALGILERLPLWGEVVPGSADDVHLEIEAVKLALADAERHVADPRYLDIAPSALLDDAYLRTRAERIDPAHTGSLAAGRPPVGDTVYLSAADAGGMMVSFIQSNYMAFGSGIVVPGTGISLQNRGACFALEPGHPNRVGGAKRPFHTLVPAFVMRGGQPVMSFGVMGGPMQAQGHVQLMVRIFARGENPQAAIDAPRWHALSGSRVGIEPGFEPAMFEGLAARGHELVEIDTIWFGGAQAVFRLDGGGYLAASEPRKDGQAVGF